MSSEYPHREESMSNYRVLWASFLWAKDDNVAEVLLDMLDEEQGRIAPMIDPFWQSFASTLPGHEEWRQNQLELLSQFERKKSGGR